MAKRLTEEQKKEIVRKNTKYWKDREEEASKHYITDEDKFDKEINKIYKNMLDGIQKEIDTFYTRYADKEGIKISTAKRRVSKLDIEAYERKAERYVKTKNFSNRANEEMRLYNLTMKINRLEMLKANIGLELLAGTDELDKFMEEILQGRTKEELERQAGILGKTVTINSRTVRTIPNASFHHATFSDRIWMNQEIMKADLSRLLQTALIQGKNPKVVAGELEKYILGTVKGKGGAAYSARRLMRTELTRVRTEVQRESFIRNGFNQYEFLANGSCCDVCKDRHGKIYNLGNMTLGDNAPPVHPHCRCAMAPYEDTTKFDEWLDHVGNGGETTWNDWKNMTPTAKQSHSKSASPKPENKDYDYIMERLKRANVDYKKVEYYDAPLSNDEIIKTLSGGDKTQGSCASVGLAYIGQKLGMNVLDFRGGRSQTFFSTTSNLYRISKFPSVTTIKEMARSEITAGNKLLKHVETGKEYYFIVGRHAAIVRKTSGGKLQYLELQSEYRSGWRDFDEDPRKTLKYRFGCRTINYDADAIMMDIDTLDKDELHEILGYINTAEGSQRKGTSGTIK